METNDLVTSFAEEAKTEGLTVTEMPAATPEQDVSVEVSTDSYPKTVAKVAGAVFLTGAAYVAGAKVGYDSVTKAEEFIAEKWENHKKKKAEKEEKKAAEREAKKKKAEKEDADEITETEEVKELVQEETKQN